MAITKDKRKKRKSGIRITYGLALHGKREEKRVIRVLREKRTIIGKEVSEFEKNTAKYFGKKYGVMVNSGSSANLLATELLNLDEGTEVITPILTFATTVSPLLMKKLVPIFTDVDAGTYTANISQIEKLITKKTGAIFLPLLLGNVPDLVAIRKITNKYKIKFLIDSCDTFGATINGYPIGRFGDIVTTSFYGSHIITAGGNGGMVYVDDKSYKDRLLMLRGWGRGSSLMGETEDIELRYKNRIDGKTYDSKFIFNEIGYNFLPSEMGAAFGNAQLARIEKFKKTREENFTLLLDYFAKFDNLFTIPVQSKNVRTQWLSFPLTLKKHTPFSRFEIVRFLEKNNIQTRPIFTGNILFQPGFRKVKNNGNKKYPVADHITTHGFVVGCHHGLTKLHIRKMISVFDKFFKKYNII